MINIIAIIIGTGALCFAIYCRDKIFIALNSIFIILNLLCVLFQ